LKERRKGLFSNKFLIIRHIRTMDNYQNKIDTKRLDKREAKKKKDSNIYTSKHIRNVLKNIKSIKTSSPKDGEKKKEDKKKERNEKKTKN
jgi:hypothetical protein